MQALNLKPNHKLVKSYYETLGRYGQLDFDHEGAVRSAFQALLRGCGRQFDCTLIPEYPIHKPKAGIIKVDGATVDTFRLACGFWEAKDQRDDLEKVYASLTYCRTSSPTPCSFRSCCPRTFAEAGCPSCRRTRCST